MAFYHCSPTAGPHGRLLPHPLSGKLGNGKKRILPHIKTNPWAAPLGQTMGFPVLVQLFLFFIQRFFFPLRYMGEEDFKNGRWGHFGQGF